MNKSNNQRSCINRKFFRKFINEVTIHGVKYLGHKKLHLAERVFWIISLLWGLGGSGYLMFRILYKYFDSPVIISFQPKETAISQIPFPAITLCNVNLLKRSVISKHFIDLYKMLEQGHYTTENTTQELFELGAHVDHLGQFCLQPPSFRRSLNETMIDAKGRTFLINNFTDFFQNLNENVTAQMQAVENSSKWQKDEREIFRNATGTCEEMLIRCIWAGDEVPCTNIFFPIETRHGHCCVFNMMPNFILQNIPLEEKRAQQELKNLPEETVTQWREFGKDDLVTKKLEDVKKIKSPKHQQAGGKPYGLSILVNPNLDEYSACTANDGYGFKMVAHSPISFPAMSEYGAAVPPSSEVFVEIEPDVTVADDKKLYGIPLSKRNCYLKSDEQTHLEHFNYYSPENCFSECMANHTYLNCSCVRFFMPRNSSQQLCGAKRQPCADEVRVNLTKHFGKNSFCGHCLPYCTEINYKSRLSHFDLRLDNVSSFFTFQNSDGQLQNATNYSIVHIFMGTDSLYAKERNALFEWQDLLASAGGVISLALGISFISFIEIVYFFTLRAFFKNRSMSRKKTDGNVHSHKKKIAPDKSPNTAEYYNWAVRNGFDLTTTVAKKRGRNSSIVF